MKSEGARNVSLYQIFNLLELAMDHLAACIEITPIELPFHVFISNANLSLMTRLMK